MSATIVSTPTRAAGARARATRIGLLALAVVVLLAASFAVGRGTVNTSGGVPAVAPTAVHPYPAVQDTDDTAAACFIGRPC